MYMHHEVPWPPSAKPQSGPIHLKPNLQCLSTSIDALFLTMTEGIRPFIIYKSTLVKEDYFALPFRQLSISLVGVHNHELNKKWKNIWVLIHAKS